MREPCSTRLAARSDRRDPLQAALSGTGMTLF